MHFLNENVSISIKISLKFVPNGPINNIPSLVQITAWHRPGDKPLSEPMMLDLPTHICVTRPQWVNHSHGRINTIREYHDYICLITHWGWVTQIFTSKLTIIGSDNGLSPGRCQAIIWTKARILLIGPFGTNFSEVLIYIYTFSFKKMYLKMSSGKWRPSCRVLNVLFNSLSLIISTWRLISWAFN